MSTDTEIYNCSVCPLSGAGCVTAEFGMRKVRTASGVGWARAEGVAMESGCGCCICSSASLNKLLKS